MRNSPLNPRLIFRYGKTKGFTSRPVPPFEMAVFPPGPNDPGPGHPILRVFAPVSDTPHLDDHVFAFSIEDRPVRGRLARLGAVIHDILTRHNYPEPVANLLGETCALAVLVGSGLKAEGGKIILQVQGDGPVQYAVADYDTSGALRGFCRFDQERVAEVSKGFARPGAQTLIGKGMMVMTVDQGAHMERYQGVTPVDGESLSVCAEHYFAQSEQIPTKVMLAVGTLDDGTGPKWRAGGAMIQRMASDEARGDTQEDWNHVRALFDTTGEDELLDPNLEAEQLLYRLFHEDGVRVFDSQPLRSECRCSQDRILGLLKSFDKDAVAEMVEEDGLIRVTCEYCSRTYSCDPIALNDA